MPRQNQPRSRSRGRSGGSAGTFFLGILLGAFLTVGAIAAYFYLGKPPAAVTDRAAPWEPLIAAPQRARARAEAKQPPFPASEDVFEAGARTYHARCASCHGAPGQDSTAGGDMNPRAAQFFSRRDRKATAAHTPGELYWDTAFGIRRSGMPAFNHTLSDTELWQIALLLRSAGDDLPDPVNGILRQGVPPPQPSVVKP